MPGTKRIRVLPVALATALVVAVPTATGALAHADARYGSATAPTALAGTDAANLASDFNAVDVGDLPAPWSPRNVGAATGTVGVAELPDRVDRSLRVAKTAPDGELGASVAFGPLTGTVQMTARVRVEQTSGWYNVLYVATSGGAPVASIAVRDGQVYDAGSGRNAGPAAAQRWYALRLLLRTATARFDLYVDGRRALTDVPFRTPTAADVGRVTVAIGPGYAGTVYADTVAARGVPDPSVNYLVRDQFNEVPTGASPPGYEVLRTGGDVSVQPVPSDADRSLLLTKPSTAGEARVDRSFAPQTGVVTVQANLRTDETAGIKAALYLFSAAGQPAVSVQFEKDWLRVCDSSCHRFMQVTAKEWYTLRLVVDVPARQFELFVDGRRFTPSGVARTQVAPRWPFRDSAAAEVSTLMATLGAQTGTLRLDNVLAFRSPVEAPPGTALDVRKAPYGAAGDGVTDDTEAIQRAIDDVPAGGSVVLAGGVFLSGTIKLKSDMTLWVNRDAMLLGTWDQARYPKTDVSWFGKIMNHALVLSQDADRVRIDGGGTINGHGQNPAWNAASDQGIRPALLLLTGGHEVSVRNVSLLDAGFWTTVLAENDGVLLADLNVDSDIAGNRDGIDLVDVHNSLVERVSVWSDDDAICFKSYADMGVDTATVRLSTVGHTHANGVKFGTASTGGFQHVDVEDVLVKHTVRPATDTAAETRYAGITLVDVDGAKVSDIAYRRVTVDDAMRALFVLLGKRDVANALPRWISGVEFSDIVATNLTGPSVVSGQSLNGTTYRVYNVLIANVRQTVPGGRSAVPPVPPEYGGYYPESSIWSDLSGSPAPATGLYLRHLDGVTIRDSISTPVQPDARPFVGCTDVRHGDGC